jgi:hypothetical protein
MPDKPWFIYSLSTNEQRRIVAFLDSVQGAAGVPQGDDIAAGVTVRYGGGVVRIDGVNS